METKEYFEKVMFFENLPSMVFTPPSVPPLAGDRNLRREEETAPCWRARYRCALRLAGHQSPRQIFAGWDRLGVS